ncbi:hypothetical protein VNO77_04515 [Canavalia gladiata]|uniref:Uncharacterized protein n=1 Tax=Canavalia gladiata TaxID=3824 RepID=A0AAN9R952_CANGL
MPLPSTLSEEYAYLGVFPFKQGVHIFLRHQPCEFSALTFVFHELPSECMWQFHLAHHRVLLVELFRGAQELPYTTSHFAMKSVSLKQPCMGPANKWRVSATDQSTTRGNLGSPCGASMCTNTTAKNTAPNKYLKLQESSSCRHAKELETLPGVCVRRSREIQYPSSRLSKGPVQGGSACAFRPCCYVSPSFLIQNAQLEEKAPRRPQVPPLCFKPSLQQRVAPR